MKKINVAINGFGRIGRSTFRALYDVQDVNLVAIADVVDPHMIAYLAKYDSIFGIFHENIRYDDSHLIVNGRKVNVITIKDDTVLPWKDLDIDVVVESTGKFTHLDKLTKHLDAGAKRVILSAPPKEASIKTVVLGVNDHELTKDDLIVSNASCTTNCLAPLVKVLDRVATIEKGFATTVHAYTSDQKLVDSPHHDFRRSRAAAINIIPTSTGAAKATALIFPHLKGKLTGAAYRVPVINGSVADFMCIVKKSITKEEINAAFLEASENDLKGILKYTDDYIVSSDIIGSRYSSVFDSKLTDIIENMVRVVSWYDNESGYSHRLAELIIKVGQMI